MAEDVALKVIILGSSTVGKTSIFLRYFQNEFTNALTTIGIDFKNKYFKFEGTKIKISYIDTAGQEKFRAISENYLKGTDGVILVFDLTKKETFDLVNFWLESIVKNNKTDIGKILFGNKNDLVNDREVNYEDGKRLAEKIQCNYYEGSAKTGENIDFIMNEIAKITYFEWKKNNSESRTSIRLCPSDSVEKEVVKKKKCCKFK